MTAGTAARRALLYRRIRLIVGITIGYNVLEAVVALAAGSAASSAAAVAWQFTRRDPGRWEKPVLRIIAIAFFALAAWVAVSAALTLAGWWVEPEHSPLGIAIATVSVLVTPFLSWWERVTGREAESATAVADSKQALICTYLSAALLVGLVLHAGLGWWWADSLAALVIAGFAVREGVEAWSGDTCATSVGMLMEGDDHE
ncbi:MULTISPECIES: cation transporter [Microbacterium]|uniref:cation transporter n=1 Tax=Microbacterium TaxID=33882 RepID=UPI00217EC3E9|nr:MULTISPECIES: cation transporter [Microbacterium]